MQSKANSNLRSYLTSFALVYEINSDNGMCVCGCHGIKARSLLVPRVSRQQHKHSVDLIFPFEILPTSSKLANQSESQLTNTKMSRKNLEVVGRKSRDFGRISSTPTDIRVTNYSEENIIHEIDGYAALINAQVGGHPWVQHLLPLHLGDFDLIEKVKDGILFAAILDHIEFFKGVVSWKKLNLVKKKDSGEWGTLNVFKKSENHRIVLNTAIKMGVKVVNIGESDLIEGRVPLVLGLTRQILTFKRMLEFQQLMETKKITVPRRRSAIQVDSANTMMMAFVNSVLDSAGKSDLHITNFTSCLKDSVVYLHLLHEISPGECSLEGLEKSDELERAGDVIANAKKIGADSFIRAQDIVHANPFLNFDLVVAIACTDAAVEKLKAKEVNFGQVPESPAADQGNDLIDVKDFEPSSPTRASQDNTPTEDRKIPVEQAEVVPPAAQSPPESEATEFVVVESASVEKQVQSPFEEVVPEIKQEVVYDPFPSESEPPPEIAIAPPSEVEKAFEEAIVVPEIKQEAIVNEPFPSESEPPPDIAIAPPSEVEKAFEEIIVIPEIKQEVIVNDPPPPEIQAPPEIAVIQPIEVEKEVLPAFEEVIVFPESKKEDMHAAILDQDEEETFDMSPVEVEIDPEAQKHTKEEPKQEIYYYDQSRHSAYRKFKDESDEGMQIEDGRRSKSTQKSCCRDHCLEIVLGIGFVTGFTVLFFFLWNRRNG
jgi:hypothetical protein